MKVSKTTVEKMLITDVQNLDAISVYFEDICQGQGKVTITCYAEAWTCFWGGIGKKSIKDFFLSCDNGYLSGKLNPNTPSRVNDYEALPDTARQSIIQDRREGTLTQEKARELYDRADELSVDIGENLDVDLAMAIFGYDFYDHIPRKPNHKHKYFCRILDTIKEAIRPEVE